MALTALLSVSDKTGILDLASALHARGVKLLSTGGTARLLADAGLPVTEVAEVTGFPEMMDGRVKTLHPRIHGGLLARRDLPEHMAALKAHDIATIDLLIVNLYPFEATVAKAGSALFNEPSGVLIASDGSVLVLDTNNGRIRRISASGQVTTLVGGGGGSGTRSGHTARWGSKIFGRSFPA